MGGPNEGCLPTLHEAGCRSAKLIIRQQNGLGVAEERGTMEIGPFFQHPPIFERPILGTFLRRETG